MDVLIFEIGSTTVVTSIPIKPLLGQDNKKSDEECYEEAWNTAVPDGSVKENERDRYRFKIILGK